MPLALGLLVLVAVLVWPPRDRRAPGAPKCARPAPRVLATSGGLATFGTRVGQRVRTWSRRGHRWAEEEVGLLDGLASALDAGLPADHALLVAVEARPGGQPPPGWGELEQAALAGQPLAPVWGRVARRTSSTTAASVSRAWAVATRTGAPMAAAVRSSAAAARERRRLLQAVRVGTAGARATVLVLTALPVLGIGLASVLGITPVQLYGDPFGATSALVGLTLLGVGHLVVARLVARVTRGLT